MKQVAKNKKNTKSQSESFANVQVQDIDNEQRDLVIVTQF
jgi:hypothetical protein